MNKSLITLAAVAALSLSGCASLDNAGYDSYTVRSYKSETGQVACCELDVKSGKEYGDRAVQFQTNTRGAALAIGETDSKAVKSQALAVKALTVLPVTGLQDLTK